MKILIVNDHLDMGGISQSLINMLYNIQDLDIDVDLQLLKHSDSYTSKLSHLNKVKLLPKIRFLNAYNTSFSKQKNIIDKSIKILSWIVSKVIDRKKTFNFLLWFVPKAKEYDLVISFANDIWASHVNGFYGGCNDYVLKKVRSDKKIAWIHNDPQRLGFTHKICTNTYKDFNQIVNVSYACQKEFDKIIPEYKYKSKVVFNMFDIERVLRLSNERNPYKSGSFHIVTVARLDNQQKRIDKIISCCEKLKSEGISNFLWHIVGDGPDMSQLITLSKDLGTDDVIVFEGKKENPYPYMKYADLFVLTSDYEAYGMVLRESLIVGTPVISTNFPASFEVLSNNNNSLIVEMDYQSISLGITKVLKNLEIITSMNEYIELNEITNYEALNQFKNILGKEKI